jgi:excinuclease ABC subunit B
MQKAIDETNRRRAIQQQYNQEHGITPQTIQKAIRTSLESEVKARRTVAAAVHALEDEVDRTELVRLLEEEMLEAARNLEFERAAQLRDKLQEIKGAPLIHSGSPAGRAGGASEHNPSDGQKIWEPKTKGRGRRNVAK